MNIPVISSDEKITNKKAAFLNLLTQLGINLYAFKQRYFIMQNVELFIRNARLNGKKQATRIYVA